MEAKSRGYRRILSRTREDRNTAFQLCERCAFSFVQGSPSSVLGALSRTGLGIEGSVSFEGDAFPVAHA